MRKVVVIHYHEIGLKKGNRDFFEKRLQDNIHRALRDVADVPIRRLPGRLIAPLPDGVALSDVRERLRKVFGIAFFAFGAETPPDLDTLQRTAWEAVRDLSYETFCVRVKRAEKRYPMKSNEIERAVGAFLVEKTQKKVNLTAPDVTCFIEIMSDRALVYAEKIPGPGGLPIGTSGRVVSLMSGGIDSPVAAYKLMRRGARVIFAHFHGAPFTDSSSQHTVRDLVKVLTPYQYRSRLYLIPFGSIQGVIVANTLSPLRVVLYRRMMMRIAEEIARREQAEALVTGESLGQVASQTLTNLAIIDAAANLPVFRPLIGDDKETIVKLAQEIGTFDISTVPFEDCCPLFMPVHPETRASLADVQAAEARLDVGALVRQAIENVTIEDMESPPAAMR
jgi:thiamine biosynthesis protein ThiI